VTSTRETSFGSVLGNIFSNDFPSWTVSVNVAYPLGRSAAKASLARSRLERTQAEATRQSLEMQIAAEVRAAGRSVTTNLERVQATRSARELAEQRLAAEQRKFEVGRTPAFFVFQAQRDLAFAGSNEQRAILAYIQALVDFDAVQEVPLFGGP
jgi:outer membrane protein TolC